MTVRRILALLAAPFALAAVGVALSGRLVTGVSTSLDELIDGSGRLIPASLRSRSSGLVPVMVSSSDPAVARRTADALFTAFHQNQADGQDVASYCLNLRYRLEGDEITRVMDFCRAHRAGLVAPSVAEKLRTPEGRAAIARAAVRKYYASPVPPLFSPDVDPFGLLDGFVASLPQSFSGWIPKGGVLTAERNGETHVLMLLKLKNSIAAEPNKLIAFKQVLDAAMASVVVPTNCRIAACGVPLHTAISVAACKREIGLLSWFSLLFIAALAAWAFHGVRWIPLLALSLATAVLSGLVALLVCFDGFHLMTAVMGTTVLGLVIDYSFHWLMQTEGRRREIIRNLLVSFATTEISLVPLMLSSISVLRQVAVFLGAGLAAALAYVIFCYPQASCTIRATRRVDWRFGWARGFALLLALVAVVGLFSVRLGTEMSSVYRSPSALTAPERLFAELSGTAEGERGFIELRGNDFERLLETEYALALPPEVPRLSRFLPPLAVRRVVAEEVAKLYAEQGSRQAELLGLAPLVPPSAPAAWVPDEVPLDLREPFWVAETQQLIIPSAPRPAGRLPDGVVFCQPKRMIADILSMWTDEAFSRLGQALLFMLVALFVIYRYRAFAVFAPSAFAILAVAGLLGLLGEQINLFHLLACFLLAGMSVDYTVFLHSEKSLKPALCSLLTSIVGFGALVFVSFPVVQAFGLVLGAGLPIAFVAALATRPCAETVEKAASPLGLEALFLVYRLLGLRALHFAAAVVGVSAWLFARDVRRASPSLRKVIHFTRSLADKLVVMAGGRTLPHVETDGSQDAADFIADVRAGRGVFVLSSHCGTVEALVALGETNATFHAWMDIERTSVFNRFYLRHAHRRRVVIHPISEIGLESAFFAGDALERGDSLVMAGDRGHGAFRFAHALRSPVYFVACVWTGRGYRAVIRRLPEATDEMERAYRKALASLTTDFPDQWYEWRK